MAFSLLPTAAGETEVWLSLGDQHPIRGMAQALSSEDSSVGHSIIPTHTRVWHTPQCPTDVSYKMSLYLGESLPAPPLAPGGLCYESLCHSGAAATLQGCLP